MKKALFVSVIFAAALFTSCKKDRICECTSTLGGSNFTSTYTIKDSTKADAKEECDGHAASGGASVTCKLK